MARSFPHLLPLLAAALLLAASQARADILELDDGRLIEGVVVQVDGQYHVQSRFGPSTIPAARVKKHVKARSVDEQVREHVASLAPDDAENRALLARWLVDLGREEEGRAMATAVLELDPESAQTTDANRFTALHWAAIRGHWRIVTELVTAGASVNAVGGDGGTPLHWACHHDRPDIVALLIDNGADVTIENRWGRTPLHTTARRGCVGAAEVLLARGADPNAPTKEGWTPMHVAALADHAQVTRILLANGADPDLKDEQGFRPEDVARTRPDATPVEAETLDDFVGIYDLGGGFTAKIWREGRELKAREFAPDSLYPIGPDEFFCRQEPWGVGFT